MKILKVLACVLAFVVLLAFAAGGYVYYALPNTGKPADVTIEATSQRIERGKYLANHVTVCMDCHSSRDWSLYGGPMKEGNFGGGGEVFDALKGFPGNFYASNITPFALGKWTDGEVLRAITTGVSKNGKALFPVMGYHRFGRMDQEDVYSIIAYIRTLQPVSNNVPVSKADFPVSVLINTFPQKADFQKIPSEFDTVSYGGYLVNAAGCVDCHSKTDKGNIIPGTEFGGGMEFKQPGGVMRSPNITFDKGTGIGGWSAENFVSRFRAYADSNYHPTRLKLSDVNTPMPWKMYGGMKASDLQAIYVYLKTLTPMKNAVVRIEKSR
ncbi:cytochrome C [Pedobacter sp. HMF7647]|uniref:Cytochrome C n=1 Tax=Hufsiella arboris TaxID=2695275 RepID=A0A7K1YE86_9SPHI|nr:cytochrome C [Hufsiella arboris]MXV52905.1 cytochrome C [Hufsiella arboris]